MLPAPACCIDIRPFAAYSSGVLTISGPAGLSRIASVRSNASVTRSPLRDREEVAITTGRRVVEIIRRQGPLSRAEAARRLGLSKPTISTAVDALLERGLLREVGRASLRAGRSPRLLGFNARTAVVVGVDLGATNLRLSLADLEGDTIARRALPTPRGPDLAERLVQEIRSLRENHAAAAPLAATVVGTPGVVEGDRIRLSPNLPALEAPGFLPALTASLPCPVEVHNDVNLAAIAEARAEAAELVAVLAVGTGLGAGLARGREVWTGARGRAGEIGYIPFRSPAGANLEDALSGIGLCRLHRHFGGTGEPAAVLARRDEAASRALDVFLDALALAVTVISCTFDPARLVLGGGVGDRLAFALDGVRDRVVERGAFVAPLEVSALGDLAAQRGAVLLATARASQELLS